MRNTIRDYRRAILLGGASLVTLASPCIASAADAGAKKADDTTVEAVIVTGYRASLQNALDNKRISNLPIESIAPEDIGKMPDQNVAESLQRLPGVQIDRAGGQGTAVLIDGLRQNLTTLNGDVFLTGKEFYVSGEGSGGGAGGNAQYGSLEGVPSEEISGIDVYKNPKASLSEGGLGGTIDLKTRDPLAQPMGLTFGGNFRETTADDTHGSTPNATLVASYKPSSRLGFTGSISLDRENTHTKEFQDQNRNQWLITNSATGPYVGALTPSAITTLPNGAYYIEPQLAYFSDIYDQRKTLGASLGVSYKLSDSIKSTLNWFYSQENDTSITYSNKVWFNGQGASPGSAIPGIDPTQSYAIDGNGVVKSGVFNANGAETATLFQSNKTKANNLQWVTAYDNGGPLRGVLDVSYAKATSNLQAAQADIEHGLYTSSAGVATSPGAPGCNNGASTCTNATGSHGYQFAWSNGGSSGLPTVSYLAPYANILTNPAWTTFKSNWAWANATRQEQFAVKADAIYQPAYLADVDGTISAGLRFADRKVDQNFGRYLINGTLANGQVAGYVGGGPESGPYDYYIDPGYGTPNIPYSTATSNPGLAKLVKNFASGNILVKAPGTLSDPSTYLQKIWADAGVPNNTERLFRDGLSSFRVEEKTSAGYVMADLGGKTARYHANFGIRVVQTDLTIHNGQTAASPTYYGTASWNGVDSNVVPVTTSRSYTDVLPSFNFVLDISDTEKVRMGAARVMSPQDLFSLGLGNSYNFTRQTNARTNIITGVKDGFAFAGGSSGNPELDPYRASQFNLSYENYFAKGGIASIAGFFKQVDNFVETQNIATNVKDDFGGTVADVTKPVNAGHGQIYGLELSGQYLFDGAAHPLLKGFGVAANYTWSLSFSDQVTAFSKSASIPGVAKNAFTGTLFYERGGFSARTSYSWRDKSVNDSLVGSTFAFPDKNGVSKVYQVIAADYGQVDAQIQYDFNKHVGLVFSVQNLTSEVQHTYLQWPNLPFTYNDSGRRFFFGLKFKN